MVPRREKWKNFVELEIMNGSKISVENKKLPFLPARYHMVFTPPWR